MVGKVRALISPTPVFVVGELFYALIFLPLKVWSTGMGLIGYDKGRRQDDLGSSHYTEEPPPHPSPHDERPQHPVVLAGEAIFTDEPRTVRCNSFSNSISSGWMLVGFSLR